MKKRNVFRSLLCLLLLSSLLLLTACPSGEPPVPDPGPGGGENNEQEDPNVIYGNGNALNGAGDSLPADAAVLSAPDYDAAVAQDVPAGNFLRVVSTAFAAGKVFRATGNSRVRVTGQAEGKEYDGYGSVLIAEQGVEFSGNTDLTFKNMVIVGQVTVKSGAGLTFENVTVVGGVTVESDATDVAFLSCRLTGETTLTTAGQDVTVLSSYIGYTACGVKDSGVGLTVQNSRIEGSGTAVATAGTDVAVKYNTVTLSAGETALAFKAGTVNGLAAMNQIFGVQQSVHLAGTYNTVVVLNRLISVSGENNTHLYVCDNQMGGRLTAKNNNYLLADNNQYPEDGNSHAAILSGNENINGDTLMDVDARPESGADESLLPHVDKEQFVGMARKSTVRDVTAVKESKITDYIDEQSRQSDVVIVAPGAYTSDARIYFNSQNKNTTLYAYGAYMELAQTANKNSHGYLITCEGTENVTVKGITVGYEQQSCKQVYVLAKLPGNQLLTVTGAGMMNTFGNIDAHYAHDSNVMYLLPKDNGYAPITDTSFTDVTRNPDGTMTVTVAGDMFDLIQPGDVLTARFTTHSRSIGTTNSAAVTYQDLTVYGSTSDLCCYESRNFSATTYYRMADTTQAGRIIDPETFAWYEELEQTYKVDLEVSRDSRERLRGAPAHTGSIDGIQAAQCAHGSQVISCLFENMCDDGSLQKGNHARLAGIEENADGETVTITYKGNAALVYYKSETDARVTGGCAAIREGDRVYIYTAEGQLLYDGKAVTAGAQTGEKPASFNSQLKVPMYSVTVEKEGLNPDYRAILTTCDLVSDNAETRGKALVDNMSRSCNDFLFDNVVVQNTRSRGLLIKASDGVIQNCTFRNCAKLAVAVIYEIYYGESGVSENLVIKNNLIDNVGYGLSNNGLYLHYPINISGLGGGTVDEDCLLYKNILIEGNVFRRRHNEYAVYIQAAQGVTLKNNDFGTDTVDENLSRAVLLNGAMNIRLEGNTFSPLVPLDQVIDGDHYKHVYGQDIEWNGTTLFPDRE